MSYFYNEDVDSYGTIILEFENKGTAFLTYHTAIHGDTSAGIYGTNGNILVSILFQSRCLLYYCFSVFIIISNNYGSEKYQTFAAHIW